MGFLGFGRFSGLGLPLGPPCPCDGVGWILDSACLLPVCSQDPETPYSGLLGMIYGVSGQFYGGHACPGAVVLLGGALVVGSMAGSGALDAPLADGVIGFALSGHWRAL